MTTLEREIGTIFLVDDEEMITSSLGEILGREGYDVFGFTNPLKALEHMETVGPDLLISDVMMPQLNGFDLAIKTRIMRPECRILLFSAAASELKEEAWADGHDFRLLQKPVHPDDMLREIALLAGSMSQSPSVCGGRRCGCE